MLKYFLYEHGKGWRKLEKTSRFLFAHIFGLVVSFVLNLSFTILLKNTFFGTVVTTVIYTILIYSAAWNEGRRDSINAGTRVPSMKKAILAAVVIFLIGVLLFAVRIVVYKTDPWQWKPFGDGFELIKIRSAALIFWDTVYKIWNAFYIGFMDGEKFSSYIIPLFFPLVIYPLGYAVGLTRKSFSETVLTKIVYKDKK